jgi:hypothetical protein
LHEKVTKDSANNRLKVNGKQKQTKKTSRGNGKPGTCNGAYGFALNKSIPYLTA